MLSDILQRIDRRLSALGMTDAEASRRAGKPEAIRNIRRAVSSKDRGGVSTQTLDALAPVLRTTASWLFSGAGKEGLVFVPIIGRVGANPDGTVLFATGQSSGDVAELPPGSTHRSVALLVSGHSMRGYADDGALLFFEEQRRGPSEDMIGEVNVVETDTDEVLVKRLMRGSEPGLFDLESIAGPLRKNARLRWAAHITTIVPPYRARQIIHPSEDVLPDEIQRPEET